MATMTSAGKVSNGAAAGTAEMVTLYFLGSYNSYFGSDKCKVQPFSK